MPARVEVATAPEETLGATSPAGSAVAGGTAAGSAAGVCPWAAGAVRTSDTTAIGLMQAAYRAGIAMPERLSIVGFDDIDVAAFMIPPLTTVSQEGVRMGGEAVDLLLALVDGTMTVDSIEDVIIEPRLVARRSTAPPFRAI